MKIPNSKAGSGTVTAEQSGILWAQLRRQGYESVSDFARKTGLIRKDGTGNMAFETIRRCFTVGSRKPASVSLAVVMLYLEFPRHFIKDYLAADGDVLLGYLMGDTEAPQLRIWEEGLLEAANAVVEKNPDALTNLGKQVQMVALTEGVDVTDAVAKMGHRAERSRKRGPQKKTASLLETSTGKEEFLTLDDLESLTGFGASYFYNRDRTKAKTLKFVFTRPLMTTKKYFQEWIASLAKSEEDPEYFTPPAEEE